jgi:hypothetical protein
MTITFLAALLAQFVMIVILRHRLGRHWLRRPVTVFVLASVVYLGVAPALLAIPAVGAADSFRRGIQRGYIDSADLIMSAAMLALTLAYLLTHPERTITSGRRWPTGAAVSGLDWRWLAVACVPLTLLTAAGRGYNDGQASGQGTALSTNLAAAFFVIAVVIAAAGFLLRHGTRWFLPVLAVQSGMLAVAGERTPVIMDALALIVVLLFVGVRIPKAQLACAALLTVAVIASISGSRLQGREIYYTNSGISARVGALAAGLSAVGGSQAGAGSPGLPAQFATRMSSVDYGGAILQAIGEGQPRLDAAGVPESLLLPVPSFLWPAKLGRSAALSPAQAQIDAFGLQNINFIPGAPGLYLGFLSPAWLVMLFAALGAAFGWFERWLLRERTPARMVLLAGAVVAALDYEAGLPSMLVQMRSAGVLALAVCGIAALRAFPQPARPSPLTEGTSADRGGMSVAAGNTAQPWRGPR